MGHLLQAWDPQGLQLLLSLPQTQTQLCYKEAQSNPLEDETMGSTGGWGRQYLS